MQNITIRKCKKASGEITVPGDKSISHRAVMIGSIAKGETVIRGFLNSADCNATINAFRMMGILISEDQETKTITVLGKGLNGLSRPSGTIDVGNSGTTIRLISGILAGQSFDTKITGDESIQKRPMKRVVTPLSLMGGKIEGQISQNGDITPPLSIFSSKLMGINYETPIPSAQVKSAILLAGLYAGGETKVREKVKSRDHTERMLSHFGADIKVDNLSYTIKSGRELLAKEVDVPGDISSVAYFIALGMLAKDSEILIKNVGLNPTRDGIIKVAQMFGGKISIQNERILSGEPRGDILVSYSEGLRGIELSGEIIPNIIDEIPIIAVIASQAIGQTMIRDAKELRVKESDRIKTVVDFLRKMGVEIEELEDGMIIQGKARLHGETIESHGDHRIAMSATVAGLLADGETIINNTSCVDTSFPGFMGLINQVIVSS